MSVLKTKIAAELQRISEQHHGRLTPEAVVNEARDPASDLHNCFEWDDATAADQHRLNQARELIRGVKVTVVTTTVSFPIPGWVQDPDKSARQQGYVATPTLRTDRERAERALDSELNAVSAAANRARQIALGLDLQDRIDQQILAAAGVADPVQISAQRSRRAS